MGPSLADKEAHSDIHHVARTEMEDGTALLLEAMGRTDAKTVLRLGGALADGWSQRVLAHADAEEADLFPEVLSQLPEQAGAVAALARDHELMRLLVGEVRQSLDRDGTVTAETLARFTALLHIQRLHSELEEQVILPQFAVARSRAPRAEGSGS